jgi:hypothetical protein
VLVMLLAGSAHADVRYSAATNYTLHCQGCHGADGVGALPEGVPPLANSIGYFLQVPDGRRYLVQVPGAAFAAIDDAALAELLNYALQRFSPKQLPGTFRRYSAEEIASVRRSREDIPALRARLVAELRKDKDICLWVADDSTWASKCEGAYGSVN